MIDIQEIRLGNWFIHKDEEIRADSIDDMQDGYIVGVYMYLDNGDSVSVITSNSKTLEPLPITTEHLKKFFGEPHPIYETYHIPNSNCFVRDCLIIAGCVVIELGFNDIKPVEYVHDMQNLIFELTKFKVKYENVIGSNKCKT